MAWLRLYDDILDDPKIQMLSDRAFRMLINLWCLAKRNGGLITSDEASLSFSLRMPVQRVRDTLQALISANLIHRVSDGYEPHNWRGRQYESDSAAERMRRYRAKNKHVTSDAPLRNEQRNSDAIDTDSEPDTEQNQKKEVVDARSVLNRICETLRIELQADPSRITWLRQVEEMLRDHIPEPDILAGAEIARRNGVVSLPYIRAAAMKLREQPKEIRPNGYSKPRRESPHEQTARVAAELIAEFEAGNANGNSNSHDSSGLVVLRQGDDRGTAESPAQADVRRLAGQNRG